MRNVRIIATYFRLGVLGELEYRANFFIQVFESILGLVVALGGLTVVFAHTENLGGWSPDQLIALVGIYLLVGGLINLVINPSMERFMQDVRKGTLDFTLVKPADSQLLVSVQRVEIWKMVDVVMGLAVIGVALVRLQSAIGWGETAVFTVALFCGATIVYSFWLILATCSFWFVRVENILVIFQSMYSAGRWPVGIYPQWLRFILTFLVPVAFAVTVPAQGLIGQLNGRNLGLAIALAVGLFIVARLFWRYGIRFYSGASA
ncbi:MAG: ABC-2 family transporter protein [Ardenticatenaceae bacterium]|nr:ABC-2 family transporter protein [Ardenticatenaceae bacterium]MCB8946718.1 ABC-2 family transporter protein [Ardenticatenaceae bacterium]